MGIAVDTAALKTAAKDFADTLTPLLEATKNLIEHNTNLPALSWGAIGAVSVSGNYNPARDYQLRQLTDFVKCLHGINAGLYSVALHYDEVELENAKSAYDAIKDGTGKAAALTKVHGLEQTVRKDNEDYNMSKSHDDSYH